MLKNTINSYGWLSKFLHWIMAFSIIAMFVVAYIMTDMPGDSPTKGLLYGGHKSVGFTLLILVFIRFGWRLANPVPLLPDAMPDWQKFLAHANVYLLYAAMLTMTLSGFLMSYNTWGVPWFGLFTLKAAAGNKEFAGLMKDVHEIASYLLIALFCAHVVAALYHHFVLKDDVLRRMWIGKKS